MKKKNKKVKKEIFLGLLFLVILIIAIVFINLNKFDSVTIIKKNNYKFVKTNEFCSLYDKDKKEIGTIDSGIVLEISDNNSNYYNISGTDYYVNVDDTSKVNNEVNDIHPNYIDLGKEITTNDKYVLFKDDKKISISKKDKYKIKYMDSDNYYIKIANDYYRLSKNDVSLVSDYKLDSNGSEKISVISFFNISNSCNNYECYSVDNVKKALDYIDKNGYYAISVDDFKNWNSGNIKLKEKAVLLMSAEDSDAVKIINNEYHNMINVYTPETGFTYLYNDTSNTINTNLSSLNNYTIYKETSLDDIGSMLKGDKVNSKFFDGEVATSVPVLNYHFFYDLSKGQTNCRESICLEVSNFRKHLDYLRDNGFYTLTMNQFIRWIYGEIDVPAKSVLITVDDGAYGTGFHNNNNLMPILEEYKMHATLFLISGWWEIKNYKSSYLEIQSHTHDMHNKGPCGSPQLICASYNEIKNDLSVSINTIGNNESFCFPFYAYDQEAIRAVKDSGFKIAFGGGNVKATRNSNKFVVPRYPIYDGDTAEDIKRIVD